MLFSTVTKLSIKPKAPFLEDETTKGILRRTSGKGSEMLQSGDTMFTLVAVVLGEVLARSRIDWDLHPLLQFIKALTSKEGAREELKIKLVSSEALGENAAELLN